MRRDPLVDPEPLIRRVYSYVAYRIGDGPEAQDVTSETFERALRGRKTYDSSKGTPIAWLLGIARTCVADALESRELTFADPPETPDQGFEERSVARLTLDAAIAGLDERERDLIALRFGADLTARRIGEVLGMRTNAVEVALHRTLRQLSDRMEAPEAHATPVADSEMDAPRPVRVPRPPAV
jgi:RNA polymerase sigma factor (sigma-70 family)